MGKARSLVPVLIALIVLAGTTARAAGGEPAPAKPRTADELRRYCLNRMNIERSAHPRGAPNWTIYDRCIKQNAER
jgi:hypothetical protein